MLVKIILDKYNLFIRCGQIFPLIFLQSRCFQCDLLNNYFETIQAIYSPLCGGKRILFSQREIWEKKLSCYFCQIYY